jgi:hypothetical protein
MEARQLDPDLEDILLSPLADPVIRPRDVDEALGDAGVLDVDDVLRGGDGELVVRAPDLTSDVELAHPQVGELDLRVLAGGARQRVAAPRRRECLAHAEHEGVRLVERPGTSKRDAPLLVLELEVGESPRRRDARRAGADAQLRRGDVGIPRQGQPEHRVESSLLGETLLVRVKLVFGRPVIFDAGNGLGRSGECFVVDMRCRKAPGHQRQERSGDTDPSGDRHHLVSSA